MEEGGGDPFAELKQGLKKGGGSGSAGRAVGGGARLACCACVGVSCLAPASVPGKGEQRKKLRETRSLED